jgi:hypothetical protein
MRYPLALRMQIHSALPSHHASVLPFPEVEMTVLKVVVDVAPIEFVLVCFGELKAEEIMVVCDDLHVLTFVRLPFDNKRGRQEDEQRCDDPDRNVQSRIVINAATPTWWTS